MAGRRLLAAALAIPAAAWLAGWRKRLAIRKHLALALESLAQI